MLDDFYPQPKYTWKEKVFVIAMLVIMAYSMGGLLYFGAATGPFPCQQRCHTCGSIG